MKSVDFRNDPMFLRNQFARDGTFEMPVIKKTKLDLDDIEFIGYDKLNEGQTDKIVHFFLDDYKFEVLWKDPEPRVEKLKEYRAILSPHWDYGIRGEETSYRIFEDDSYAPKAFEQEGVVLK